MATIKMTAEQRREAKAAELAAAQLARKASDFRTHRARLAALRPLHVNDDGWFSDHLLSEMMSNAGMDTLAGFLSEAFEARREVNRLASRLAADAAENVEQLGRGREPWNRMTQRGADFDAAVSLWKQAWRAAGRAARMAGVHVPELDPHADKARSAALAVDVVGDAGGWSVVWTEGELAMQVPHETENAAWAQAADVAARLAAL